MLNLNITNPITFPGRAPRLNRAHPLFNTNLLCAAYSVKGGMTDLITGLSAFGTTTLSAVDENGPSIWSNDAAGTATVKFLTANVTTYNFLSWGSIFKYVPGGSGRIYLTGFGTNSGWFINGATLSFQVVGGTNASVALLPGHTYFAMQTNAVGTAAASRFSCIVDLDTGIVQIFRSASSANLAATNTFALQPAAAFTQTSRVYAMFLSAAVLIPPAVQPAAGCFYSTDQVMAALSDPWGLWYA